jgi:asparagine synthase (glutamine-hydrolysing)
MCGICGIVRLDGGAMPSEARTVAMRDSMTSRGPDDAGLWRAPGVALGHRRLAILDLSPRGHQPMASPSGRYRLVHNGEIYNYRALREILISRGYSFQGQSDTEVLAAALDEWSPADLLPKLDGIFAFAAWDIIERRLIAARDPLGVKPLHYALHGGELLFASEIKALWRAGARRELAADALEELLVFRFTAGGATPFRGIRRLRPGHWLVADDAGIREQCYWRVTNLDGARGTAREWAARFTDAVRDQRVSDVPIGTLLSGGLDSSAVTAELARTSDQPLETFTISIPPEDGLDEAPYAEAVARHWNCHTNVVRIPDDDLLPRLGVAQAAHDEPLAHGNDMHLLELCYAAKKRVTVLISGEGADETLGGYLRYLPLRYGKLASLLASPLGAALRALARRSASARLRKFARLLATGGIADVILYNAANVLPEDLTTLGMSPLAEFAERRALLATAARATCDPLRQLMLHDVQTFLCSVLDRNDRMTMAASIECRVPFLSVAVVEAAFRLPTRDLFAHGRGKWPLRELMAGRLPSSVLERPKWGFGVPWARYLRNVPECRDLVATLPTSRLADALGARHMQRVVSEFLAGDTAREPLIHQLFSLRVWWDQVVEA